ncbi:MAG: nicotinate-nucleotide diphosphorylase (carboxylating), partial [Candidatus Omnitrophica bacterium]|nr:nicotinate-nucleotide diphosphorylase (carboxylating) [Candidatus Omnitrophota bacterium]
MDADARRLIKQALREDRASRDITSRAIIPPGRRIRVRIIAKSRGIAAGVRTAALTFTTLDPSLRCRIRAHSGAALAPGRTILT